MEVSQSEWFLLNFNRFFSVLVASNQESSTPLRPKSMNRRSTLGMTMNRQPSTNSEKNENTESNQPKEKKTTRSKLLQRLFGSSPKDEDNSENSNPNNNKPVPKAPMSFLDQIKARGRGKVEAEASPVPANDSLLKPKNPLLAALSGGGGGSCMSFLDQIKSRRMIEE